MIRSSNRVGSERLMFSTRQNIPRILTGEEDFISAFAEDVIPPMSLKDIGRGTGHAEWVWAGTRYFDQGGYEQAREQGPAEAEGANGPAGEEVELDEWQNPIEQEAKETEHEPDAEATVDSEEGAEDSKEQEAEVVAEEEQEQEHEEKGGNHELLEAQPQ